MKLLLLSSLLFGLAHCHDVTYDGHQVIELIPTNGRQLKILKKLQRTDDKLDFWMEPTTINHTVDLRLSPDQAKDYMPAFKALGLKPRVVVEDVQSMINEEVRGNNPSQWSNWTTYEELEEIEEWMKALPSEHDFVSVESIGKSYEGRDIWLVNINKNPDKEKKLLWMDCNINAREWITSAVCTWMIDQFLNNATYESLLDDWEFSFLPILNPDGFAYSHAHDRLWRKTRSPNAGTDCVGTDPDRNWDWHWNETTAATDSPCSETYHGSSAFSEKETQAVRDAILERADNITLLLSFHSFSQFADAPDTNVSALPSVIYETGRSPCLLSKAAIGVGIGLAGSVVASKKVGVGGSLLGSGGTVVRPQTGISQTGISQTTTTTTTTRSYGRSGDHVDWSNDVAGISSAYDVDLHEEGRLGVALPSRRIRPACKETMGGVVTMMNDCGTRCVSRKVRRRWGK